MGNLAKKANIRTPSLYKHFSSLMELEHIIISRGFLRFAKDLNHVIETAASDSDEDNIAALAAAYRAHALAHPQIYRLMTERPLDRALLIPGSELAAMAGSAPLAPPETRCRVNQPEATLREPGVPRSM